MLKFLRDAGFQIERNPHGGSHNYKLTNLKGNVVTVPNYKELEPFLVLNILKQAGITRADFERYFSR